MNVEESQSPLPPLKSLLKDFPDVKASAYANGWEGEIVNKRLNNFLIELEERAKLFNEPPRTARLKLALTTSDPQAEFMSKAYREARDEVFKRVGVFFQKVTHHGHEPGEDEFRSDLSLFESLLLNYLTPCTATQQNELMALIAGTPSPEALARVDELISHKGANYIFFFEKLDNPNWLPLLEKHGHFADLPEPESIGDGRVTYKIHVPLISLVKLAASAPKDVTSILAKLKLPDNSRVGDQVLQCIAKIHDAGCIAQLRPLVLQLSENPSRTSWLWIQELLKNWIELNVISDVLIITEGYLFAAIDSTFNEFSDHHKTWLTKQVDEQALEQLTTQRPFNVVTVVYKALNHWTHRNQQKYPKSDYWESSSAFWLENFKNPPQHHRELEGTLAARLFKAAEQIYRQGDDAKVAELDQLLRENESALFARLRWQLYADFPAHALDGARRDVVALMPTINRAKCGHNYEFAQMLYAHVKLHGTTFLSSNEVKTFFEAVFSGPLDVNGEPMKDYEEHFRLKQLWPISTLLQGKELDSYCALLSVDKEIGLEDYKEFRSGDDARFIQQVPPKEADRLASMTMPELWDFLNTWQPKGRTGPEWWIEEDFDSLATKFAEYVESQPERFNPVDKWWQHLKRPALCYKFIDRASKRIEKKPEQNEKPASPSTESDWANWFGVAAWTVSQRPITEGKENQELDWTWARIVVATFLQVVLRSQHQMPEVHLLEVKALLGDLINEKDPRLDGRDAAGMGDWLTTAINSARGDALEALLELALKQKNAGKEIEPWIFELIRTRLELPTESPAVFALLGAKLRFVIHLFGQEIRASENLLFPPDRPEYRSAAIKAHFSFDQPWNVIIETFPEFIKIALDIFQEMRAEAKDDEAKQNQRDFGSQLGTHIVCYYWNGSFAGDTEGEAALDRFFAVASKSTRATLINQIAWIWEKHGDEPRDEKVMRRVMRIWERRYAQIENKLKISNTSSSEYDGELAESIDWLNCECLPFEWRLTHAKLALERLKKAPQTYRLLKAITAFSVLPGRLEAMLELFRVLLKRPSDELRWSIQFKELAPVISLGLASENPNAKKLAKECKDLLLKMGFSDFLNLGNENGN